MSGTWWIRGTAKILRTELQLFVSLVRWLCGRRDRSNQRPFRYDAGVRPLLWMIVAVVVVEGTVVDLLLALIIPGSMWILVVLGFHVYGLLWLLGFLSSTVVRPHVLSTDTFVLRDSVFTEVVIPFAAITDVTSTTPMTSKDPVIGRSGLKVSPDDASAVLAYGEPNVTLTLDPEVPVRIDGCAESLRSIEFTADQHRELIGALRESLGLLLG